MKPLFIVLLLASALATLSGCTTLAPDYTRPEAPIAGSWPKGEAYAAQPAATAANASELAWRDYFVDPKLRAVIELALANNRDLRVAGLNIEKARAQYQVQRADLLPSVNASASTTGQRLAADQSGVGTAVTSHQTSVGIGFASYELDFFGRVRSLKDQALFQYLATEEAQSSAQISLVAEVASAYLTLAADSERLGLAQQTLTSQQTSLQLIQRRFDLGTSSALELQQARTTVESARSDVARYTRQVAQDQNALALLVGGPLPASVDGLALGEVSQLAPLPAGLPASQLAERPDVRQAERSLEAANANIGAARAAFFPRISLTANLGSASSDLANLFQSSSGTWSFIPQISLPIFDAGRNQANLDVAKVSRDIALAQYEKAIQTAFREAADALAAHGTLSAQLAAQTALLDASRNSYHLAEARFKAGVDSYLTLLDSQRSLYAAQQTLITARLDSLNNRVTLYKVLGGGGK